MPVTKAQKTARDTQAINAIIAHLAAKQDAFFAKHGRYFQLLRSPVEKADADAERAFEAKYDPTEKFPEDLPAVTLGNLPFQTAVNVYKGGVTDEARYDITLFRDEDGVPHFRRIDPKAGTDTGWLPITEK